MDRVGIGVVGCGFVGMGAHVPSLAEIEGARFVGIADADEGRRTKVAKKYKVEATYATHEELIANPAVQAVIVSVPTPVHGKVAMAAIEAGKHVLCEMPLASTLQEADRMIEAAKKKGVFLMPSLTFRFTANYVKAKQLLDSGAVGSAMALGYREWIPASDLARQWPPGSWMWKVNESGGPLFTLAVWSIDLLRWLTGSEITSVKASTKYTPLEKTGGTLGYDAFAALSFASGQVGFLQYSGSVNRAATLSKLEVVGDKTHVLTATDNDLVTLLGEDPFKTEWNLKQSGARMWGHYMQDEHFIQCIQEKKEPSIKPSDGRKAMEVAIAIGRADRG